jgi:lambda family phage portal protein
MYAATLETDFGAMDPDLARETFGADPETQKTAFPHVDMTLRGVRVPHLPPGTKLKFNAPARPAAAQFSQFEATVLRRVAAGLGMSYEQVSRDYSQTNYSSARASLLEAWKFMQGRSEFMATNFADHAYALWLEEAINNGDVELPAGAPDFYEARADWVTCRWIGPGRGWIDPNKEAQASQMKIDAGLSTLEDEAAEQGKDWQELLEQRAFERDEQKRLGLQGTGSQLYRVNSTSRDEPPAQQEA